MAQTVVFDPAEQINPAYYDLWEDPLPYNVLSGGRSSFKSSVVSMLMVHIMLHGIANGTPTNIVVIRKVASTIRDSVFKKIQWALGKYGILDKFQPRVAPFRIGLAGSKEYAFYFYGQDDYEKLKSNDIGNLAAVWYEEASEFSSYEEFDQTNITFRRQHRPDDIVRFFWTFNPPRNPHHWINTWDKYKSSGKSRIIHTTYLDDTLGFVDSETIADAQRIKEVDLEYYKYIYLGIPSDSDDYFFPDIVVDDDDTHQAGRSYYLGIDCAYTGGDKIIAALTYLQNGIVHVYKTFSVKKSKWKDGVTGDQVIQSLLNIIHEYDVRAVACDRGEGAFIIEELSKYAHRESFSVRGISFGGGVSKTRKALGHYPSNTGYNKRAEMYLTMQEFMQERKLVMTSAMKQVLEEQMSFTKDESKPEHKIKMIDKAEIKQLLGHSPDELDGVVLSLDALIADRLNVGTLVYT